MPVDNAGIKPCLPKRRAPLGNTINGGAMGLPVSLHDTLATMAFYRHRRHLIGKRPAQWPPAPAGYVHYASFRQ